MPILKAWHLNAGKAATDSQLGQIGKILRDPVSKNNRSDIEGDTMGGDIQAHSCDEPHVLLFSTTGPLHHVCLSTLSGKNWPLW